MKKYNDINYKDEIKLPMLNEGVVLDGLNLKSFAIKNEINSQATYKDFVAFKQNTIAAPIRVMGIALHNGQHVAVELLPAPANYGVQFQINNQLIRADFQNVVQSPLCTEIRNNNGDNISTIEHLLSALYGLGIDNILIKTDGNELPILDGSAAMWVKKIAQVGINAQEITRSYYKITREIRVEHGDSFAVLRPYHGFKMDYTIDYQNPFIGRMQKIMEITPESFQSELMLARTFCLASEIDYMRSVNKAQGGSLENAVVVSDTGIINPEGLRYPDEFVRHKMLDAVGDLALAGRSLLAHYECYKGGHALNNKLLRALFSDSANYIEASYP